MQKYISELFATMILVLIGVGGASFIAMSSLEAALMFALAVIVLAFTFGKYSGGHANPSITLGHFFSGRLSLKDTVYYIIFQIIGALFAGAILYTIANDKSELLATNQVADSFNIVQAGLVELIITFIFVSVILRITSQKKHEHIAPIIIGITLGIMVGIAIPITNGSLNFARSLSVAIYNINALQDVWIFLIFPSLGGVLAGIIDKLYYSKNS